MSEIGARKPQGAARSCFTAQPMVEPNFQETAESTFDSTVEPSFRPIWRMTEEVLELFRSRATNEVQRHKRPDVLWVDDVTRTQGNMVITVRQLSEEYPNGVTLKKLAEVVGTTPAAASVMVDVLVKKKMLKRTRSRDDRRSVLIRLSPETAGLFDSSERSLQESAMILEESLGSEVIRTWREILVKAAAILREAIEKAAHTEQKPSDPSDLPTESEPGREESEE